ncbi:hypothetical protein A1O1_03433 [Capronia coronata CBS 617.96]|uniref:Uncharacterized protein n=1 Tax=Capronia coronata CBS 617.96 TaxID=1182541 RepID=W9Z771_9EURO|nr:uncharacterized protein A1O1_03433 [Capronia coronata CBS 617.96]EXJ90334.1 hypothetical protein A1O1_03433 [Capronia coronata CBS 617.96]
MATLFTARRKPKRIVRDEPESKADDAEEDSGPVVRRPTTNTPKTKSKLRVSFNPGDEDATTVTTKNPTETGGAGEEAVSSQSQSQSQSQSSRPSRLGLSSAAQSLLLNRTSLGSRDAVPGGQDHDRDRSTDRPTYSKAYLEELRNSTPTTPRELSSSRDLSPASLDLVEKGTGSASASSSHTGAHGLALDLESKFGKGATSSSSRIPTAAEIREKKERRARLAQEQAANAMTTTGDTGDDDGFIPLEDYDSDGEFKPRRMQVGSYVPSSSSRDREKDTRLVRDDEDFAEGFDEFVEDTGRVTLLSRRAQREQTLKEREAIRSLIEEAERGGGGGGHSTLSEGNGDDSDDPGSESDSDSEYERHQLYESAQTHRAMDGLAAHAEHTRQANRPRQPRHTTPIPKLSVGLARLRDMVSRLEYERARIEKRRADIVHEKADIKASQAHIQSSLEEAGRELERVTSEHWSKARGANGTTTTTTITTPPGSTTSNGTPADVNGHHVQLPVTTTTTERGLESFGNTPENTV